MGDQMKPRGGKHPGEMPKAQHGGKGGRSPKHQCGNQPGYGNAKEGKSRDSGGMKY